MSLPATNVKVGCQAEECVEGREEAALMGGGVLIHEMHGCARVLLVTAVHHCRHSVVSVGVCVCVCVCVCVVSRVPSAGMQ